MKYVILSITLTINCIAYAETFKCVDEKKHITYSDKKCKKNQKSTSITIKESNTYDSSKDREAIENLKKIESKNNYNNYPINLKRSYEDPVERDNNERMRRMDSALPNGLGTGKGCYWEHKQLYCY